MIDKTFSHYKILKKLGGGGMGVVYKAEDTKLKRTVTLKFLPPDLTRDDDAKARFINEAQAASALDHLNICTIYEIDETADGQIFIAMAYYDGETLKQQIAKGKKQTANVIEIAIQIAQGLAKAHEHGITHRDIKPANVIITKGGVVKIIDFGLAKLVGQVGLTKAGIGLGTAAYMSPEQTLGEEVDQRTDIWALGVVLYEMLTGHLPFRGEYEQAVIYSILNEEPKPMADFHSDAPTDMERIVRRALAKNVQERYQTVAELLAELQEARNKKQTATSKEQEAKQTSSAKSESFASERRQITVMFCDLVNSTLIATQLDPEDFHEVLRSYHDVCAKVISRFEGYVAQYLGDGVVVYFGYPQAHEDDAQRAVRSGLGIIEAIERMNARLDHDKNLRLQLRVGIHTGLVVVAEVGTGSRREQLAMGEAVNIAARLQGIAEPNTVTVSNVTYRLIEGFFKCQNLGAHPLKGILQPMELYQVLHESTARSRMEAAAITGLTPLVGREKELGIVQDRWEQAVEGNGHVVLLSGEAGIGKSRLVWELKKYVASHKAGQAWLTECACSPYHQNSALYPMIDFLERAVLQFQREDSPQKKLAKLEGLLAQSGLPLPETVPLFAALLSIPLGERYAPLNMTPERQKQMTLATLLNLLLLRAAQQPMLFVVEDLHWADPTSLELLNLIVEQAAPTSRILTVLAFRPDFTPRWPLRSHLTYITFPRLPRKDAESMVLHVAKDKAFPKAVREYVFKKTDGIPLFVEEMTKMLLESGLLKEHGNRYQLKGSLVQLSIPAALRDSLMERLDRLTTAKEVAQFSAVLGREFPYEWLQAVSPFDETTLHKELTRLVEAELLFRRGVHPQATYIFKHALIQEAAYESLLKSKRQQYHQQIAQALAERFPEIVETKPELLAHHYTAAGLVGQAIPHWHKAGQQACQRSANLEAIAHLTQALELLKMFPDSPEKIQQELLLQITLGPALMTVKGYAAPDVKSAYDRARELCQQVGEASQLFRILAGLWGFYLVRAEYQTAHELAEQLFHLAQNAHDPHLLLVAHNALGMTLYGTGEFISAREHLEAGLAFYDSQQHHSLAFLYGQDLGTTCLNYLALTLWHLGYPDLALEKSREALKLTQELPHPFSLAQSLDLASTLHHLRREAQATQQRAEAVITLSTEQGYPFWLAAATMLRGWALTEQEQVEEGIAQIEQGLAALRATGAEITLPYYLALLAEAYGKNGQAEAGLAVLAEAFALVEKNGERFCEAKLYRLKGGLLMETAKGKQQTAKIADEEAETCFHQALEIARRQKAKSLELRAAMSLGRLWLTQGKKAEARELLSEVYNWFAEGVDTADLQEAKTLLGPGSPKKNS